MPYVVHVLMQQPDIQNIDHWPQRGDCQSIHDCIKLVSQVRGRRLKSCGARRVENQVCAVVIAALPRLDEPPKFVVVGASVDQLTQRERDPLRPIIRSDGAHV